MKVVPDTNVLVSGLLFGGVPGRILTAWSTGAIRLVISPPILEEYRRVGLALSKGREPLVGTLEALLAMLTVHALLVDAPPLDERVSEDPDDEMFLAAALAANARLIVSGDTHLLRVSGWRGIEVLKARPFVDRYIEPADIKRNVAAVSARRCAAGGHRAGARRPSGRTLYDALQQNVRREAHCGSPTIGTPRMSVPPTKCAELRLFTPRGW